MKKITFAGLAYLVLAFPVIGASKIWLTPPSGGIQLIYIKAAPGTHLHLVDGVRDLGTVQADRSGVAKLAIPALSSGAHSLRAVKWGTGEIESEPLSIVVPARPPNRLPPSTTYTTGIHADFGASGDLHGNGWPDLILGSANGISLLPIQDGVPGRPQRLVDSTGQWVPTAVTVIDANGDGRNDVAITSTDGRVAVLFNQGGGVFSPAHHYTVGANPSAIVTADFNGDGIPDLAIANQESNTISILQGNGDGSFQSAVAIPCGYSPRALVVADFNGDGLADLATANFAGNDVSVLLGNGHGGFQAARAIAAGNGPVTLVLGDLNRDGTPDLAVLNQLDKTVSILLNDGSGNFQMATTLTGVSSLLAGDVDGDGYADLLLHVGDEIQVRLSGDSGDFDAGYSIGTVASPLLLAFEDFDHNGLSDVAVVESIGEITLLTDSSNGRSTPNPADRGFNPSPLTPKDLSPLGGSPSSTTLRTSATTASFGQSVTLTATVTPSNATGTVTFFDGSTLLAIKPLAGGQASLTTNMLLSGVRSLKALYPGNATVAASTSAVVNQTIIQPSSNGFLPVVGYATPAGPSAVTIADVNNDGKADLVVANSGTYPTYSGSVSVYRGNGDGTFQPAVTYSTGVGSSFVAVGDINGDGAPELIVANWEGTVSVLGNKGDGTFLPPRNYGTGQSPFALVLGDFNGDGTVDIAVANSGDSTVTLLLGSGTGAFTRGSSIPVGSTPQSIVVGDFNGDGNTDLAVASTAGVSVLLGNGNATFQPAVNYIAGSNPYSVVTADFNGDGRLDLAVANLDSGNVSVLLGNGDGTFRAAANYPAGINSEYVAVGDFNGDGAADLAVANFGPSSDTGGNVSILYGNGNGSFRSPQNYLAGSTPYFVAAGNLNGDATADLAVVDLNGSSVGVMLGNLDLPAYQLRFTSLPATGTTGSALMVAVQIQDAAGNVISGSSAPVTLVSTPSGVVSTVNAVSGTATFRSLSFSSPGSYTLTATSTGLVPAISSLPIATPPSLTVSGRVTSSGVGISGVTINVNGSQTTSTVSDASGNYSIGLSIGGTYTLSPTHSGYSFSPPVSFSNLNNSQTANFTAVSTAGLLFYPITPCRIADTRTGAGFSGLFGPPSLAAGATRTFPIQSSGCSIPANAGAYSFNFTVVPKGPLGLLTAWPTGQAMPNTSTLSSYTGTVMANGAIVPAGAGGAISIYVNAATDVLFDINGYFAPPGQPNGLQFYPVTPCRIADTRAGAGFSGPFGPPMMLAGGTRTFPIFSSSCGIPPTAAAYSLNFTVVPPGTLGVLTTWPTGTSMPNVSTLNSYAGNVLANAAIVPAGANGAINVYVNNATDMLFDINGYFAPPLPSGLNFYPLTPCRIADTRAGAGFAGPFGPAALAAGVERSFPVPFSTCEIPASAGAYSLNFTVVPPGPLGLLTTWPTGSAMPNASTLNSYNGTVISNAAIVPSGTNGAISLFVNNPTDVLFDINGYFAK